MSAFGSETAKPQYAYSNSPSIRKVYHYAPTSFNKVVDTKVTTCRQYKNKAGKDCWVGTAQLKDTEILGCDKISPRTDRFEKHSLIHTHAHASPSALPRIYPDLFGLTISELLDDLRSNQRGCPKLPECVPTAFNPWQGLCQEQVRTFLTMLTFNLFIDTCGAVLTCVFPKIGSASSQKLFEW